MTSPAPAPMVTANEARTRVSAAMCQAKASDSVVSQHRRLEREAMARPLGGTDHAAHDRHVLDPEIVEPAHLLEPDAVGDRGHHLDHELGEEMRRQAHPPGIG